VLTWVQVCERCECKGKMTNVMARKRCMLAGDSSQFAKHRSSTFQRAVQAVPVLHQFCVLVVTDPDDVNLRLRVAPEYNRFDVPLDFSLKAIIGPEHCTT
jgi:hypothetical protein